MKTIKFILLIVVALVITALYVNKDKKTDVTKIENSPIGGTMLVEENNSTDIKVLAPMDGETLTKGNEYEFKWWDNNDAGNRSLELVNLASDEITLIGESAFIRSSGVDGNFYRKLMVPSDVQGGTYKLKVCKTDTNECGLSEATFNIK